MAINSLHELATTRFWSMESLAFGFYRDKVFNNAEFRIPFLADETKGSSKDNALYDVLLSFGGKEKSEVTLNQKVVPCVGSAKVAKIKDFEGRVYIGNAVILNRYAEDFGITPEDTIVNMVYVSGPITRNSGMCSVGSMQQRDQMMMASNYPNVVGHIIYLNTPGGSTSSLQDFQYAFDYCRSKKQSIIGLVDGMCASMGTGIASQCDEVYFVNPKDKIGCIGTLVAFFTQKDGDVNTVTKERYVEIYAPDSIDKNKDYRDASNENYELITQELVDINNNFKAAIKAGRPSVTDDQMTGKMYPCGEVIGTLVDGQGTIGEVAAMIVERMPKKDDKGSASGNGSSSTQQDGAHSTSTSATTQSQSSKQNKDNMKNYSKIASALGVEELGSDKENGVWLQEELADKLESSLTEKETAAESLTQQLETANATIETRNQTIASLQASQGSTEADVTAATQRADKAETDLQSAQQEIETLKGSLQEKETALNAATETVATQKTEVDELKVTNGTLTSEKETLETAATANAETVARLSREKEVLQDEITGLKAGPGAEDSAGEQPKNNNTVIASSAPVATSLYDENLSPAENAVKLAARNKELKESRNRG